MAVWSLAGWVTLTVAAAAGAGNGYDGSAALPEPIPTRQDYFFIPFQVDEGRNSPPLSQVELWASGDRGRTWKQYYTVDPQTRQFPFRAGGDGEFWFAIRTIDAQGQARPEQVREPGLRVVVDTTPPKLMFEADRDPSGQVRARWKIEEKNLAEDGLIIQYRAGPNDPWQNAPINRMGSGPISAQSETTWLAPRGARQLEIRAEVVDLVGNRDLRHAQLKLTGEATEQGIVDPFQAARNTPPAMRPGAAYSPSREPEPFGPKPRDPDPSTTATHSTPESPSTETVAVGQYGSRRTGNPYSYADAPNASRERQSARSSPSDSEEAWASSASPAEADPQDSSPARSYDASRSPSSAYGQTASPSPYERPDRYRADSPWQDSQDSSPNSPHRDSFASSSSRDGSPSSYSSDASSSGYASDTSSSPYGNNLEDRSRHASSNWHSVESREEEGHTQPYGQPDRDWGHRSMSGDSSADRSTESWQSDGETWRSDEETRRSDERGSRSRGRAKRSVRIVSVKPATGRNADRMVIRWETQGPSLASNTVKLFYATSRFGPWEPIADNLMSTAGEYVWKPDESLRGYVYVRIEIPDPSGGMIEAETSTSVRLPDPASTRSETASPQEAAPENSWADPGDSYSWP